MAVRASTCTDNGVTEVACPSSLRRLHFASSEESQVSILCWVDRESFWEIDIWFILNAMYCVLKKFIKLFLHKIQKGSVTVQSCGCFAVVILLTVTAPRCSSWQVLYKPGSWYTGHTDSSPQILEWQGTWCRCIYLAGWNGLVPP